MMDEIHKRTSPLRIFLCHSSGDKPEVRKLYQRLSSDGFDPWLDEEDLLPGQKWKVEIPKAVKTSDVVIVCLSHKAINKSGYVQKEIKFALDKADEQPEDTIYLIPLKLEECDVPERLQSWQWVNLFEEKGYERLMQSLHLRAETITSGSNPKTNMIQRPEEVPAPETEIQKTGDQGEEERKKTEINKQEEERAEKEKQERLQKEEKDRLKKEKERQKKQRRGAIKDAIQENRSCPQFTEQAL